MKFLYQEFTIFDGGGYPSKYIFRPICVKTFTCLRMLVGFLRYELSYSKKITLLRANSLAGTCSESFVIVFTFPKSFTTKIAFITHAMELDQAFAHCPKFLTAAIRRSLDRVSVLVRLNILSDQLRIVGLVSLYLTNYLILRRLIIKQLLPLSGILDRTLW
jgi:hypothetical protein